MSTRREFQVAGERIEGQTRSVIRITCSKCGVITTLPMSKQGGSLPVEILEQKFRQKGWTVGHNDRHDLCPACAEKARPKPALKIVDQPKADPPRQMERDDRRIIFAKLSEVYLDEKRGYAPGWSDQKVATDLGIPRKWVEDIRKENFGDVAVNEDMEQFRQEAIAMLADARAAMKACESARQQIVNSLASIEHLHVDDIRARLGAIEKLAKKITDLLPGGGA